MATITNYLSGSRPSLVEVVGTYNPFVLIKIEPTTAEATAGTLSVSISELRTITGAIVQILNSGNNVATSDADITWSGNTLTIANGSSYTMASTDNIYTLVWGIPRA